MYANNPNFELNRPEVPPSRDRTRFRPPADSGLSGIFNSTGVLESGVGENLYGRIPNRQRGVAYKYLLDGPNFKINQAVRLDRLRLENRVEGGKMLWFGDKAVWMVDRDIICAGSVFMKNALSQYYVLRNKKVRVRPIHV
jgi:hypothetical protein